MLAAADTIEHREEGDDSDHNWRVFEESFHTIESVST